MRKPSKVKVLNYEELNKRSWIKKVLVVKGDNVLFDDEPSKAPDDIKKLIRENKEINKRGMSV